MRTALKGTGVALSAMTFMIWTGVTASAEDGISVADETVSAIDAVAGQSLDNAIDVVSADSTVTAGGGVSVDLSSDATDGISIDSPMGGELEIGLPFAQAADDAEVVDGVMVYDNNNGSTTTPLVKGDGSVQILTTITDANAPTDYEYSFATPEGSVLRLTADGGAEAIMPDGSAVGTVAPPWAFDALGASIDTWFEVDGNILVQHVDHSDTSTVYPVVADPWWGFNITWSNSQVNSMIGLLGTGAGVATIAAGICNGTVFGAIPCSAAYAVAAGLYVIGTAGLTFCNRNGRGTVIRWLWVGGFNGCSAR